MNTSLHLSYGSSTDNGLVKEFNTDSLIEFQIPNGHVFVVCDGHNGTEGHGALAAKLTTDSIQKYFFNKSYKDIIKALTNAITYANLTLFELINKNTKYKGISSTIATVIYSNGLLHYAYAGDSRIYAFKNNTLQPLTRDHVDTPANAMGAEVKLLIGKNKDIKFGVCKKPLTILENDTYLICTDGLTDQLTNEEISNILSDDNKSPEHKCQDFIDISRDKGGVDCTSVQVLEFSPTPKPAKRVSKINLKNILIGVLGITAIVTVGFGVHAGYNSFNNRQINNTIVEESQFADKNSIHEPELPFEEQKSDLTPKNQTNTTTENTQNSELKIVSISKNNNNINSTKDTVYHKHKIKYGDNLYRIAIRYNTTQKTLISINDKRATNLIAGSNIKIPITAIHKVKSGESLSSISDKFNIKIIQICIATGIDKNTQLQQGQSLVIPLHK